MMSDSHQKRNLALSGWSGAGTSTVTLILAHLLQRRYYYLGSVFREVVRQLTKTTDQTADSQLLKLQDYIQPTVGKVIDQYVDYTLLNASGIILETDISAFRLGKRPEYYSVFLKTNFDVRAQRFTGDQRSGDEQTLREQDEALRQEYLKLWNIDMFDENLIAEKFNYILDTSNQTILESVSEVLDKLGEISDFQSEISRVSQQELQQLSQSSGPELKNHLRQKLQNSNLLISPQQMISEIARQFPDEIQKWPEDLKQIFQQKN